MQIELSQQERFEIAEALNAEAKRFEDLISIAREVRRDWRGASIVWSDHVIALRTLCSKVLGSSEAKAA